MIRILSADVSLKNIGWAYRCVFGDINDMDPNSIVASGTVVGTKGKDEPTYKRISEVAYLLDLALTSVMYGASPHYIVIERSFIAGSGDVSRQLAGTQSVIQHMLYHRFRNNDFILLEPSPPTWRSIILGGQGKVDKKKSEVWERCRLWGLNPKTEHEAEAQLLSLSCCDEMFRVLKVKPFFSMFT